MEQIRVSELASEFELKHSLVIDELKKIGVWVPSSETPVDQDIANRIRRRLQLMVEIEQDERARAEKAKEKKKPARPPKAAKKTIRELGKTRKARKQAPTEAPAAPSPLASSLKPRKGKASYRTMVQPEEQLPERVEVSIHDEPVIETVEAQVSAEAWEALQPEPAEIVAPAEEAPQAEAVEAVEEAKAASEPEVLEVTEVEAPAQAVPAEPEAEVKALPEKPGAGAEARVRRKAKLAPPPRRLKIVKRPAPKPTEPEPEPVLEQTPVSELVEAVPEATPVPPAAAPEAPAPAPEVVQEAEIREVALRENLSVKELSERISVKSKDVLRELMKRGVLATVNQTLDAKTVEEICETFNIIPHFVSFEEAVIKKESFQERPEDLAERAPVVTVMGHVDHGKTSLLDSIRKTDVVASEAGGITQHIGAYHVKAKGKRIVFIDTPGHEAFTRMRARGAKVTDIVVLVVAADDGVMPQTREAIDHARAAGVPILVAINKIDRPEANVERVKRQLSELQLAPEEWGGDTVTVEVSAVEGTNIDQLLEMILLVAELQECRANPKRPASGVVLEARLDKGRGAVATVLIQNGSLKVGDSFIAGTAYGKVRAMFNDRGKGIKRVGPSSAVEILGLQGIPLAGDPFQAVDDASKARQIVDYRQEKEKEEERAGQARVSLDELYAQMREGSVKELPMVLKADMQGSVEVLRDTLEKLSSDKVKITIIRQGAGAISETDVLLASASGAIVIGFNVRPEQNAQATAEREEVELRLYTVIYEIADDIKKAMLGLLEPTLREAYQGRAEVRDIFRVPKFGTIAGCYVLDGSITRKSEVRLLRDNVVVYEGRVDSLRRFKDDVNSVKSGYECGVSLANFNDVKPGDIVEAYTKEEVAPELS